MISNGALGVSPYLEALSDFSLLSKGNSNDKDGGQPIARRPPCAKGRTPHNVLRTKRKERAGPARSQLACICRRGQPALIKTALSRLGPPMKKMMF